MSTETHAVVVSVVMREIKYPSGNEDFLQAWLWQAQHHCVLPLAGEAWCETVFGSQSLSKKQSQEDVHLEEDFAMQSQEK